MKKILSLVIALMLVTSAVAYADIFGTHIYGTVTPAPVNGQTPSSAKMYQLPGEYRPVIEEVSANTTIYVTFKGTAWHKVKPINSSKEGWMRDADVRFTTRGYSAINVGASLVGANTISSSDGYAALRWGPGTYYDKMDDLPNGRYVWRYEVINGWARVLLEDGRVGYVHETLLKKTSRLREWPSGLKAYVQVSGNSAIYHRKPDYKSALDTLPTGEVIDILGQEGSMYAFTHPSLPTDKAYISYDIVSPECMNNTITAAVVYYDHPINYQCDVFTTISSGTRVKVMATDGYVSYVEFDGGEGYLYDYTLKY